LIGYHLAEGGRERSAAQALLDCAGAATLHGFERAAVRLAALALKLDAARDTRERASEIAERAGRATSEPLYDTQPGEEPDAAQAPASTAADAPRARTSLSPLSVAQEALRGAIAALATSDAETAERMLDTAVAAGLERASAGRLWALAQLARGDVPEAVRALKRVRAPRASGREALTAALILLEAQAPVDAVRSSLEALAHARRQGESRGERAALHVLAACYRALDREQDAMKLETRAEALPSASS
jgi:hypothetical protein